MLFFVQDIVNVNHTMYLHVEMVNEIFTITERQNYNLSWCMWYMCVHVQEKLVTFMNFLVFLLSFFISCNDHLPFFHWEISPENGTTRTSAREIIQKEAFPYKTTTKKKTRILDIIRHTVQHSHTYKQILNCCWARGAVIAKLIQVQCTLRIRYDLKTETIFLCSLQQSYKFVSIDNTTNWGTQKMQRMWDKWDNFALWKTYPRSQD